MKPELTFLIVEDHAFQRSRLAKMLQDLGAKAVHTAADGRAALALLASTRDIDLIITDLEMPGMDGMEFIRHVAATRYVSSLAIASALEPGLLASVESMATAYGINFLGAVEKPMTPGKLQELLKRHRVRPTRQQTAKAATVTYTVDEILDGLSNNQFEPFFQPKVDIKTGAIVGAEALARWRHPQQGLVAPDVFIKVLEDADKIDPLFRCILIKATDFCHSLRSIGNGIPISVNLSLKSLADVRVADDITSIVCSRGITPQDIILEVTESAATAEIGKVLENLCRLRMKGFALAIDDYGTGYSSLEQLTRIPFSELKIDQAFVTHAGDRQSARVILESSIDLARRLEITAVAEGVETQRNWDLLRELGCDVAQGYYLAKPMAAKVFADWLLAWPLMHTRLGDES